jgi:hypothetical protein
MRRRGDTRETVLIAVLRVLHESQDAVSSMVGISKSTVVETEKWLKEAPIHEVRNCLDDKLIKETVERDVPYLQEINPIILAKALQVTAHQALAHYRMDWKPVDAVIWRRHWDDLSRAAGVLAENLKVIGMGIYEIDGSALGGVAESWEVRSGYCADELESRIELKRVDGIMASCLISHLGIQVGRWSELKAKTIPEGLIHTLDLAARRRTFEGTCEICGGWSR